ncbi:MAG: OadG family protein [Defluviitaleaceae bacterium]|nr:OadG family protein [Defluviitaleaceae bacterium]
MEYLPIGFATMLIGFFAVTVGLLIILMCINLLRVLTQEKPQPSEVTTTEKQDTPLLPEPAQEPELEAPDEADDMALVAAITAGLCAYMGISSDKIVVRSIRRAKAWSDSARTERQSR